MTVCRDLDCEHPGPTLSSDIILGFRDEQRQANLRGEILSFNSTTETLEIWAFPSKRNGEPLKPSTVYRAWNRDNDYPVIYCYCGLRAQFRHSTINSGFYYIPCHGLNSDEPDSALRNASNKCGFRVILTNTMMGSNPLMASSPIKSIAGTPTAQSCVTPARTVSGSVQHKWKAQSPPPSPTPTRRLRVNNDEDFIGKFQHWTPLQTGLEPIGVFYSLVSESCGVRPAWFNAAFIRCRCGQWVSMQRMSGHRAMFCGRECKDPTPPSDPTFQDIPACLQQQPLPDGVALGRYNEGLERILTALPQDVIDPLMPAGAICWMDEEDAIGLTDGALFRVLKHCSCGNWVALEFLDAHLDKYHV
ncbi:hypothetical protein FRB94_004116 [Tulasnella sp. JGI-2019a]|nr:hypothetical protein FRB94_004116 [Tulasnella sp. JGI-2019a]